MLIANLNANAALTKQAVGRLVESVADLPRTCDCQNALATALITQCERVPDKLKRELAPIIGKYLPAAPRARSAPARKPQASTRKRRT